MAGTILPFVNAQGFAQRMVELFPESWVNDAAKIPGGILYSLFQAIGTQLTFDNSGIQYANNTTRLASATDVALDTWSLDFFGGILPRLSGESDTLFRKRIQVNLFAPAVTRQAIQNAVAGLTGITPRMGEPWSTGDAAVYDNKLAYYDVDGPKVSARWGDPSLKYQGFIESVIPLFTQQSGGANIYGFSPGTYVVAGGVWNTGYSSWWAPAGTINNPLASLFNLILNIKAEGTTIWVKIVTAFQLQNAFVSRYNESYYSKDLYYGGFIVIQGFPSSYGLIKYGSGTGTYNK